MHKLSKVALLVGALMPASLLAQTIEGKVVNNQGEAVVGASVKLESTGATVYTDEQGRFEFTDLKPGVAEIHIVARGFAHLHQDLTLENGQTNNQTYVLGRTPIEVIDVTATPVHMSVMESAAPVSVLSGERLRQQQAATLGDSLEQVAGVHTNFHGNVASTPVIRGLSGPRVLIAQNGLEVSDVSRVGPDHAVASEASTAQQIEVLRGPATLFYGSGAVGGVVNVVDNRVPSDNTTRGEFTLQADTVSDQKLGAFNVTTGKDNLAFYADAYWRESDDYEIPVAAEAHDDHDHDEDHGDYTVENSAEESSGFTLGASYLLDNGFVGLSVERFNREYGIPGHAHGSDEDEGHDDHDHDDHDEDEHMEEMVFADLEQTKVQLIGEFALQDSWIRQINLRAGLTDYEHAEIEGGVQGTLFENDSHEIKVDLLHGEFAHWNGGISLHYKNSEVAAQGEEAFTPPSESETIAVAIIEERHLGDVLLQLGARVERVTLTADNVLLPLMELHGHDDDGHDHDHGHEDGDQITRVFATDQEFTPVSVSAGIVWDFSPGYNLGVSLSRSERAPSASELLSFGPHIGTGSYEVGALFALHEEDGEQHLELTDQVLDLETANNLDITLRKTQGDVGFVLNAFYNQVDNYYYQAFTGLFAEVSHGHEEDEHDHGEEGHVDELPVYLFRTDDVILHGFEAQLAWQASNEIKVEGFADYVRARIDGGEDLPRISPMRFGTRFSYQDAKWNANLSITRYQEQDKIAALETVTPGYTLVEASIGYDLTIANQDITLFLKGENLTDTEARVHTSFLKDITPRPGRNFTFGIRGYF